MRLALCIYKVLFLCPFLSINRLNNLYKAVIGIVLVTIHKNGITLAGHAGYAPRGQDIVCAAVSALTYTLQESLNRLTEDTVGFSYAPGRVDISFADLSAQGQMIINSFIVGMELLAGSYPDNVNLSRRE